MTSRAERDELIREIEIVRRIWSTAEPWPYRLTIAVLDRCSQVLASADAPFVPLEKGTLNTALDVTFTEIHSLLTAVLRLLEGLSAGQTVTAEQNDSARRTIATGLDVVLVARQRVREAVAGAVVVH